MYRVEVRLRFGETINIETACFVKFVYSIPDSVLGNFLGNEICVLTCWSVSVTPNMCVVEFFLSMNDCLKEFSYVQKYDQ